MRWPFMTKTRHEQAIRALDKAHLREIAAMSDRQAAYVDFLRERYQDKVDAEFIRARKEGRQQVHAWATEANYNLFCGMSPFDNMNGSQRARAAAVLQDAEDQFAPARTILTSETLEITQGEN